MEIKEETNNFKRFLLMSIVLSIFFLSFISASSIIIDPYHQVYNGEYEIRSITGNNTAYNVTLTPYNVQTGSYFDSETNSTRFIYKPYTNYSMCADFETKKVNETGKLIDYDVPFLMKVEEGKTNPKIKWLPRILEKEGANVKPTFESGDKYCFYDTLDPTKDFYKKYDQFSVEVVQLTDFFSDAFYDNIVEEVNHSHINISDTSPYNDLIGYWNFDVNTSLIAGTTFDWSNQENDGTLAFNAVTKEGGFIGDAISLDGNGDRVDIGNIVTANTANLTYSMWFRSPDIDQITSSVRAIMTKQLNAGDAPGEFLFATTSGNGGELAMMIETTSGLHNCRRTLATSPALVDDTWYNSIFQVSYNGTHTSSRWFLDNVETCSNTTSGTRITRSDSYWIGSYHSTANREWNGEIDEVMIFNTNLTDAERTDLFNNQSARFKRSGTQTLKQFNITSGDNAINVSLNSFQALKGSNISVRVGAWEIGDDYNLTDIAGFNLVSYFNLDNRSDLGETGVVVVDRMNVANGTSINGTIIGAGIWDNGYLFDGTDDGIIINDVVTATASDTTGTWTAWVKPVDATPAGLESFIAFGDTNANENLMLYVTTNGFLNGFFRTGGVTQWHVDTDVAQFTANEWTHIALVQNGTLPVLYVDGVVPGQAFVSGGDKNDWIADGTGLDNGRIGDRFFNSRGEELMFNGNIDEVMFFNRSLSSDEIKEVYVKGRANWAFTAYKNYTDGVNLTINSTTTNNLLEFRLESGEFDFYSSVLNDSVTSQTLNVTVAPTIKVLNPTNTTLTNSVVNFNFTNNTIIANPFVINYNGTNATIAQDFENVTLTVEDGAFHLFVYANSTTGATGVNDTIFFSVDATAPIITVQSPTNTTFTMSPIVFFNATTNEDVDATWVINYNGTNVTTTINQSLSVENGAFQVFFYANDTAGNIGVNNTIFFTMALPFPIFSNLINHTHLILSPFSYDLDATGGTIDQFVLNDTSVFTINATTGVITNNTALVNLTTYSLNVTVNNTGGFATSGVFFIEVTAEQAKLSIPTFEDNDLFSIELTNPNLIDINNGDFINVHNALDAIQGGLTNERYHLNSTIQANLISERFYRLLTNNSFFGNDFLFTENGIFEKNVTVSGNLTVRGFGSGDIVNSEVDAMFGGDHGLIQIGMTQVGHGGVAFGALDMNGSMVFRNANNLAMNNIEFQFFNPSNVISFAIARGLLELGTYNSRSMMIGGDLNQTLTNDIVNCTAQGYTFIGCDTEVTGADFGIEDDLEVRGSVLIKESLNVTRDLNVTGNFTGNQIYAEMWFQVDVGSNTTTISTALIWENISGFLGGSENGRNLNGFSFTGGLTGVLTAQVEGKYKATFSVSFGNAGNNQEYQIAIAKNNVIQNQTNAHRKLGASGDVASTTGTGFLDLNVGDHVTLQGRNNDATADILTHSANINLVRMGEI